MVATIGPVFRMAGTLSVAVVIGGVSTLLGQAHLHSENCDEEVMTVTAGMVGKTKIKRGMLGGIDRTDSVVYINQLSDYALQWHPLFNAEEAQRIVQHKQRFGDILAPAELVQCGFSVERIEEIRRFLVCDANKQWQKQQWIEQLKAGKADLFWGAKSDWRQFGALGVSANQLQWRYTNAKTFSCGVSLQRDIGELGLKEGIREANGARNSGIDHRFGTLRGLVNNYHLRVSGFRNIETLVLGRYAMQLGQGLVQGGMSGFWNAPILWARRTPDWGLAEKRGWDEYQGHTGLAVGINLGRLGTVGHGARRLMLAISEAQISARVDSLGRMSSLITDGNFSAGNAEYQRNTRQQHGTVALLLGRGYGLSWSGYQYNRLWFTREVWLRPALRAGHTFHYTEAWCTKQTPLGGLAFLHLALQCQTNERPKSAFVGGWIVPLGQRSDISLRAYRIQHQFRPPQGLFNQLIPNYWSVSATYSRGTTGKRSLRWAAELRQPLLPNSNLERPLYHKQQLLWEKAIHRERLFHCLWQWNRQADIWGWETFQGAVNLDAYTTSITTSSPKASHKITLNLKNQSTNCLKLEHQFTVLPHPQSSNASYLYGITLTYRQPFSPLKWATEGIVFDTQTPLYFTPQTLSHEITHYTLSQRGIALNANLQYTIKHKRKMPDKHKHSPQFYLATRTEIIVKNTTENPVQPRIFVALWLK